MAAKGTVFQKGGGGTNFEQYIQAAFFLTMALKGNVPGLPSGEIEEVVLQATNRGWETDDLYLRTRSVVGNHQVLVQAKHNLVFSEENAVFREVLEAFWKDYHNPTFNKSLDRLLIVKNRLNNIEKNHIKGLLNYAKTHASAGDFISEVNRIKEKKERLQIFRSILTAVSGDLITDDRLWSFLKCVDVLGYDFLNEGSVDEMYLLNLVKLSKSTATSATEKEIWNSVLALVSKYNPSGGNLTKESIRETEFYRCFDPSRVEPVYRAVEKLMQDSTTVLRPIKDSIGKGEQTFHLPRKEVIGQLGAATNESDFIIVTGATGAGKSAAVKNMLQEQFNDASVFVFRAEQFNQPHLANVLADMEISYAVEEVFSCLSLTSSKVVFIDSLEKLLEDADPENAFSQFVSLVKENGIKIVATCRRFGVDLIIEKFCLDGGVMKIFEVPLLSGEELEQVGKQFPQLQQAFDNPRIRMLLGRPKYLDFAVRALGVATQDFAFSSIVQFKRRLWDTLVCKADFRSGGLPAKREKAFMEIALTRARQMKLFVRPGNADEEAVDLLQNDEILFQDGSNRHYAPAHDLLEDWALEKYVSDQYEEHSAVEDFFISLGNEPAIRRGFRLWVEDAIIEDAARTGALIKVVMLNNAVEPYWADELLVAIFQSEHSAHFFRAFEKELLASDGLQLRRCLELIKTTCKRTNYDVAEKPVLLPVGSGWKEALIFTAKHISALTAIRPTILSFLDEWEYRLVFQYPKGSQELEAARDIVSYYIDEIELEDPFWMKYSMDQQQNQLISILYTVAPLAQERIKQLVQSALQKGVRSKWQVRSFYDLVIDKLLGGVRTQRLVLVLPDLLIETAWKKWKYIRPAPREEEKGTIAAFLGDNLADDHCWGIEGQYNAFPSSIYKTFVYHLLCSHPEKGLQFITEFVNYSVTFYVNAKCRYKHELGAVTLTLCDGRKVQQYSGYELWVAYRGLSVTDYLLECLLMSLEAFLFEVAEIRTEQSKRVLKKYYNYLLENSNSVMITGVLASVAMAYPGEVEEAMLPLVSLKEMYRWESKRPMDEHSAFAMLDERIPYAQKKRWESNQLPHRKKFQRGFADFLIDYQVGIKTINAQLHACFDAMWAATAPDDIIWRKKLTEIDARKWVVGDVLDREEGTFIVQPGYEPDIKAFMDTGKEKMDQANRAAGYSQRLSKVYEGKETMEFEEWDGYYQYYSTLEEMDIMHDRPATFAVVGLRDLVSLLSEAQVGWCVSTLASTVGSIIGHTNNLYFTDEIHYNLMEKEIALESFHLLFNVVTDEEDKKELRFLMLFTVVARFTEHEVERLTMYLRQTFAPKWPVEAKRLWQNLLQFSHFKKQNPYFYDDHDAARLKAAKDKEFAFLEKLAKKESYATPELQKLTFQNAQAHLLFIAFCMMPPGEKDVQYREFMFRYISLLMKDIAVDEDAPSSRHGRQSAYRSTLEVEKYLAEVLLYEEEEAAKRLLDILTGEVYRITDATIRRKAPLIRFVNGTLDMLVYRIDDFTATGTEESQSLIERFWVLWHHLFSIIQKSKKKNFINVLLLDTEYSWDEERDHLPFLDGRSEAYKQAVYQLGDEHLHSVLKVISTIGRKEFLLPSLGWVKDLLQNYPEQGQYLNTASGERFIKALYQNHIAEIKKDQLMVKGFISLLDKMVAEGNATAFLYKEDVITFRKGE